MPALTKLSLDWFAFLVPNINPVISRGGQFNIEQAMQEYWSRNAESSQPKVAVAGESYFSP